MSTSYSDAVRTLNLLQSNASVLEAVRATRDAHRHLSVPETIEAAERIGVKVEDIDRLSIIHVSGTKGKGSTCAFTESILRMHGFKTGFFSSPHLVEVRERIRIDGRPLSRDAFSKYFWHCYERLLDTKTSHNGVMPPYFRFLTIMSFYVFLQEQVDVAVVEVGIGGQYDSTNIIRRPVVCGVASLGIDHTSVLGSNIEQIAWHKAGIFKHGVPAVTVPQPESALRVLHKRAAEIDCPLHVAPPLDTYTMDARHDLALGIPGLHQNLNASLALQLSRLWLDSHCNNLSRETPGAFPLTSEMTAGLRLCSWPGRSQKVTGPGITYYLDGAHTVESIEMCARWFIDESGAEEKTIDGSVIRVLLFNSTGDRNASSLLAGLLKCQFHCAVFCPNIQYFSARRSEDLVNRTVTLEAQLSRCADNRNAWLDLLSSAQRRAGAVSGHRADVINGDGPMPTLTFNSIADSLFCVSRGRDNRLLVDGVKSVTVIGLPDCLHGAAHVQLLCAGSLHLVGDILSLLDPTVCDK